MAELINRFPICALWYCAVARALGYTESEAQSLGLGRAVFFAWSKNGQKRAKLKAHWPTKRRSDPSESPAETTLAGADEMLYFAGLQAPVVYVESGSGQPEVRYTLGGEVFTPEMFQRQVIQKLQAALGPARCQRLWQYLQMRARSVPALELNGHLAYRIYESIRDLVRQPDFYDSPSPD